MPTYRVMGSITKLYYVDVSASEKLEAYDIANQRPTNDWSEIEIDSVIEPIEVIEYDPELGEPVEGQLL
jgi:hypothetical protein